MPATAPSRRKSSRVRGGLEALENGAEGSSIEKENNAPTTAAATATKAASKKKREADTTATKKPAKKRKKEINSDDGFEFRVVRRQSTRLSNRTATVATSTTTQTQSNILATPSESPVPKEKPLKQVKPVQLPHESPTPPPRVTKKKRSKERHQEVEEMEKPAPAPPAKTRTKKSEKDKVKKHADKVAMAEVDLSLYSMGDDSNSRISAPSGEVSKIKLPTSDTPIQRKNQQFRKGPGGERRRSSLGRRGRRASSMMQEGIIAEPHNEISHKEFYKHIDEEQMENARMKQLLSWCGKRELDKLQKAAPPGSSSSDVEGSARHVARMMAEDLLKGITTNGELSTWFTRTDSPAPAPIKKPNPRNTQNRAEQERLKAHLEVLNNEHESWQSLLSLKPNVSLDRPNNSPDFLRPEETAFKASQAGRQDIITQARRLVKHQGAEIEFSMDRLADGVHKLRAYGDAADELAGKVLGTAGDALEEEDTRLRKSTGTDALSLQEVLRSISYANPSTSSPA